jgi:hypothetical protein
MKEYLVCARLCIGNEGTDWVSMMCQSLYLLNDEWMAKPLVVVQEMQNSSAFLKLVNQSWVCWKRSLTSHFLFV